MQSSFGKRSKRCKRLHVNTFLCLALQRGRGILWRPPAQLVKITFVKITLEQCSHSVMVSVTCYRRLSKVSKTSVVFVDRGTKVDIDNCPQTSLLCSRTARRRTLLETLSRTVPAA